MVGTLKLHIPLTGNSPVLSNAITCNGNINGSEPVVASYYPSIITLIHLLLSVNSRQIGIKISHSVHTYVTYVCACFSSFMYVFMLVDYVVHDHR